MSVETNITEPLNVIAYFIFVHNTTKTTENTS